MSYKLLADVVKLNLTPAEARILTILADCHNSKKNLCNPSIEHLARVSNLDRRWVRRIIKKLKEKGIISSKRDYRKGVRVNNKYTFNDVKSLCQYNYSIRVKGSNDPLRSNLRGSNDPLTPLRNIYTNQEYSARLNFQEEKREQIEYNNNEDIAMFELRRKAITETISNPEFDFDQISNWDFKNQAISLLAFLNVLTGMNYIANKTNLGLIETLFKDGASHHLVRQVIVSKWLEWRFTEYAKFLQPSTLFRLEKFSDYSGKIIPNVLTPPLTVCNYCKCKISIKHTKCACGAKQTSCSKVDQTEEVKRVVKNPLEVEKMLANVKQKLKLVTSR